MKVYLDNCCFNRPFDNQLLVKIMIETEAKLFIQEKILSGEILLVWSYILEFENNVNPFQERKEIIINWKKLACEIIIETNNLINHAKEIVKMGLKAKDALHIACAMEAQCDYFITTDNEIIKKLGNFALIKVINPVEFITIWEEMK